MRLRDMYKDKEKQKEACLSYKRTLKCEICGYNKHPSALEFHHRNPDNKIKNISKMMNQNSSKIDIIKEISKCMVLCANCHAIIHAG